MNIVIGSKKLPTTKGGLASYQRLLESSLGSLGHTVKSVGVMDSEVGGGAEEDPRRARISVGPVGKSLVRKRWINFLSSRERLHRVAEISIWQAYRDGIRRLAPKADVVHYIGTGWDHIGFAYERHARDVGARFTIWPAVHPGSWGDDRIDIRLYKRADGVFCQSEAEREHLSRLGVPGKLLVSCGLPPICLPSGDGNRLRERLRLESKRIVFFLGRKDEGKGYPALLEAWETVVRNVADALLIVAGTGGDGHGELARRLPEHSLLDLGAIDEETKADCYAACDLFCLPSAHESFGIVFVEAMSYGKPVICGTAEASREIVKEGINGLWGNQEPAELAEILIECLLDGKGRARMGEAARAEVACRYSVDSTMAAHLSVWA